MRHKLLTFVLFSALAAPQALATCVNKDLKNLGPTAYDLAVILGGKQQVNVFFNGYAPGHPKGGRFGNVAVGPSGGNTMIHWQNFWDGTDNAINTGQIIHLGWCTSGQSNPINMYWTDKQGRPIPGSVVYNITSGWTYFNLAVAVFTNGFLNGQPITIRNVFATVVPQPLPLDQLNTDNTWLTDHLQPVPGGEAFTVPAGATLELPLPGVAAGATVVLRYTVEGPQSAAEALDFIQFTVGDAPPAPAAN